MMGVRADDGGVSPTTIRQRSDKRASPSRLFGYDIFISFALGPQPRGTYSYASDLARRLRERDFTVFFSEDDAPPGGHLDHALAAALRRSKILVVIVSRSVLERPGWLRKEVEEFTRCHPSRPVIPISVDGALTESVVADEANAWLQCRDRIWLNESREALENGIVSEEVLGRLAIAPSHVKSGTKWRWLVSAVATVLVGTTATALVERMIAQRDAGRAIAGEARARAELTRAVTLRLISSAAAIVSRSQLGNDKQAILLVLAAHRLRPGPEVDDALASLFSQRQRLIKLSDRSDFGAVALSPDAGLLVTVEGSSVIRRWDGRTLLPIGESIHQNGGAIYAVAFSPDGSRFVTVGEKRILRVWNALTGSMIGEPFGGDGEALSRVAFSPDGQTVVASGDDGIWVYDVSTKRALGALIQGKIRRTEALTFSGDGRYVVSAHMMYRKEAPSFVDGVIVLWDVATRRGIAVSPYIGQVASVAFSPDSRRIASGDREGTLRLWDATTTRGEAYLRPLGRPGRVAGGSLSSLAFSPDGRSIVSGGFDGTLQLWTAATAQPIGKPWDGHRGSVESIRFTPDGRRVLSASSDGTSRLWDGSVETSDHLTLVGHKKAVWSVACCSRGRLISAGLDKTIRIWSVDTGRQLGRFDVDGPSTVIRLAFASDGDRIGSVETDHVLRWWDANTGQLISRARPDFNGSIESAAFNSDTQRVALVSSDTKHAVLGGNDDYRVRIWSNKESRVVSVRALENVPDSAGIVVALSPDGGRVAFGGWHRPLGIWDTGTDRVLRLQGDGQINSLTFSADGLRLAVGEAFGLHLWDLGSGKPVAHDLIQGVGDIVTDVAFSGDAKHVVTGSEDGTVRIWNAATGQPLGARLRHEAQVRSVAFSADGRYVVSGSLDGTVRIWPGPTAWVDGLCSKIFTNMSHRAWAEWVSSEIDYVKQCPNLPIAPD